MKMITLITAVLVALAMHLTALAADYVEGEDYQICSERSINPSGVAAYRTCEAPGTKSHYNVAYTDGNGMRRTHTYYGTYFVRCDERRQCHIVASETYVTGEFMGVGPAGNFKLSYDFYLDMDIDGNPVAYRMGRGPQFNEEPLGSSWGGDETPIAGGAWMEE